MKKIIVLIFMIFLVSGCININNLTIKDIVDKTTNKQVGMANQFRSGYKYYLPRSLKIIDKSDFNEIAKSGNYNYYLYVDIISYHNKIIDKYEVDNSIYLSYVIDYGEKYGYVEITQEKDKYLLEIMYNYAKIEVIVEKQDINLAVTNAIEILATIEYNDDIINNLIGDNVLNFSEMEFNIFETRKDAESQYLQSLDENIWEDEEVKDTDLIN